LNLEDRKDREEIFLCGLRGSAVSDWQTNTISEIQDAVYIEEAGAEKYAVGAEADSGAPSRRSS
jgi:hypothetical protein